MMRLLRPPHIGIFLLDVRRPRGGAHDSDRLPRRGIGYTAALSGTHPL
jgi:hypothetical protein